MNIHDLDELGEGQEYQAYFTTSLSGTMASGDTEIVVGLDLNGTHKESFVHPIRRELSIWEDNLKHRSGLVGFYGWQESGVSCLDSRRVLLGSV